MAENKIKEKNGKKTTLKVLRWVGFIFLLALTVALTVNSLLCVFVKHYYPTFGKYRLFAIVSDSMEPEIPTGDMIVGRVPDSESDIGVGTVITYELKQSNSITLITHRVISVGVNSDGKAVYTTRGDNAAGIDAYRPVFKDVVGVYTGQKCGFFGYFFGFLQSTEGTIALILILLIIILTWIIIHFVYLVSVWRNIAVAALKKSGSVLAETRIDELETLADVIGIVSKEPDSKQEMVRKDKKLNWFLHTGLLPKRPYSDDMIDDMAFLNSDETTKFVLDLVKVSKDVKEETAVTDEEEIAVATIEAVEPEEPTEEIIEEAEPEEPAEEAVEEVELEEPTEEAVDTVELEEPILETVEEEQHYTVESILAEAEIEAEEEETETEVLPEEDEPQEEVRSVDTVTGMAIIVRYKKSFTAKLIQSEDKTKAYYIMLKNELSSYKKVKNRISWNHENFNSGRSNITRFSIRGKTLCVYFALDPNDYADTKYKVEHAESKKYENIPCMYRIKNARRAKYALDLIAAVAGKYGLEKGEQQNVNYYMRYEPIQPLIERGLIKELVSEEDYKEFMRRYSRREVDKNRRQFVSAREVNSVIPDNVAIALVEDKRETDNGSMKTSGKKGIVNVDVLSKNFGKNETVNLEALKSKGLVAKNVGSVKVLARGTIDKPLIVEAQDFSVEAVKMIVLTGGKATKVL